jgi:carbamoyl-phosphate synthase large subunit
MVNCNPETVSTDYDTSDRLYFEPVTLEDVLEIVRIEKPKGVIVQYGGQTPLKLARALEAAGVPVIGTSPDAIDRAEDRERFQHAVDRLKLKQPANATVTAIEMAVEKAKEIGYPLVVRPSYVSAAARWKSSTTKSTCVATSRPRSASLTMRRCCWTASLTMRLKSTSMRSATAKWC